MFLIYQLSKFANLIFIYIQVTRSVLREARKSWERTDVPNVPVKNDRKYLSVRKSTSLVKKPEISETRIPCLVLKKLKPAFIFQWLNGKKKFQSTLLPEELKRLPLKVRKVTPKRVHKRKKLQLADVSKISSLTSETSGISRSGRAVKPPTRFIEMSDSESEDPIEKKRKLFQSLLQSSDSSETESENEPDPNTDPDIVCGNEPLENSDFRPLGTHFLAPPELEVEDDPLRISEPESDSENEPLEKKRKFISSPAQKVPAMKSPPTSTPVHEETRFKSVERPKIIKLKQKFCGKHQLKWYYSSYQKKLRCQGCMKIFESKKEFDQHLEANTETVHERKKTQSVGPKVLPLQGAKTPERVQERKKLQSVGSKGLPKGYVYTLEPLQATKETELSKISSPKNEKTDISRSGRAVKPPPRFYDSDSDEDPLEKKAKLYESLLQPSDSDPEWEDGPLQREPESEPESEDEPLQKVTKVPPEIKSTALLKQLKGLPLKVTKVAPSKTVQERNKKLAESLPPNAKVVKVTQVSENDFECSACNGHFLSLETVIRHVKTVHENNGEPKTSSSTPPRKRTEVLESKTETEIDENNFLCSICDDVFKNRTELTLHIELKHTKSVHGRKMGPKSRTFSKELKCPCCEKDFKDNKSDFSEHISKINQGTCPTIYDEKNTFQCYICSMHFPSKTTFEKHFATAHEKKKLHVISSTPCNFKCTICDKSFVTRAHTKVHIASFHKAGVSGVLNSNLDDYVATLHEEKTPKKKDAKMKSSGQLQKQQKTANEGEKLVKSGAKNVSKPKSAGLDFKLVDINEDFDENLLAEKLMGTKFQCSMCNFEVSSLKSMEDHVSGIHGVKLKLRIINSNKNESTEVIETPAVTETPEVIATEEVIETPEVTQTVEVEETPLQFSGFSESELPIDSADEINKAVESLLKDSTAADLMNEQPQMTQELHHNVHEGEKPDQQTSIHKETEAQKLSENKVPFQNLDYLNYLNFKADQNRFETEQKNEEQENSNPTTNQESIEESIVNSLGLDPDVPLIFKCTICDLEVTSLDTLSDHFAEVHGDNVNSIELHQGSEQLNLTKPQEMPMNQEVHEGKKHEVTEMDVNKLINDLMNQQPQMTQELRGKVHEGVKPQQQTTVHKDTEQSKEAPDMVHEGKELYLCYICNLSFDDSLQRKAHIENVHKGKKPVQKGSEMDVKRNIKGGKNQKTIHESPKKEAEQTNEKGGGIEQTLLKMGLCNEDVRFPSKVTQTPKKLDKKIDDTKEKTQAPNLKCSICNFEVSSIPIMENHVLSVHGLKLKLRIVNEKPKTPEKMTKTTEVAKKSKVTFSPESIQKKERKVRFSLPEASSVHICRFCDQNFSSVDVLREHILFLVLLFLLEFLFLVFLSLVEFLFPFQFS